MADLFSDIGPSVLEFGEGLFQIKGLADSESLIKDIEHLSNNAQFRQMMTPMGHPTQVSMLNCGECGWISDLSGYRYSNIDPLTENSWPDMPESFNAICQKAVAALNLPVFSPNACLVNRYEVGMSMGRHQDKDELDFTHPIISVSLGLSAIFQIFGPTRQGKAKEFLLESGDVFVMSGESRRFYHGVKAVKADPLNPNNKLRYNITFRRFNGA